MPIKLACLVRVHDRPLTTRIVLNELAQYRLLDPSRLDVKVCVLTDRPTREVRDILDCRLHDGTVDHCASSHVRLLDARGEHFLDAQNQHLTEMENYLGCPDWVYIVDDDYWLEPTRAYARLIPALERPDVDIYYVETLFFQDETDTYNIAREHHSAFLFRHIQGERHSGYRMLKVPDVIYDNALLQDRDRNLDIPALEYGGFTAEERNRVYGRYIAAGKVCDAFVEGLRKSDLRVFPTDYDHAYGHWTDRMAEALA